MDAGEKYTSRMGQYPVICLTFKDAKRETFEESYAEIVYEIAHEVLRHNALLEYAAGLRALKGPQKHVTAMSHLKAPPAS